ncbi:MAG: 4-(cytidine 5'-diphospho)-2-C-methyl-D-erythritol kinase [Alphaproteobacteria bacterium]
MINEIKMLSPAKLNLYLEVINKASDGFHNLESLMCFCDFGDVIQIRKARNFSFSINGPFSKNLENNNIITSSVLFIENLINKKIEVEISLTKNIPIASGMGGGSSNAATTIICLKKLFNLKFDTYILSSLFELGCRCPILLLQRISFC